MASSSESGAPMLLEGVMEPIDAICMACYGPQCNFKPMRIKRRPVGDNDVLINIRYCGMCHSDVGYCRGHFAPITGKPDYENGVSPGHELAGVVAAVGKNVTKVKLGDQVGVGRIVDACLACSACKKGDENWCGMGCTMTYGGKHTHGRAATIPAGQQTKGGYSTKIVVHEHFCILIPKTYPLEKAGPIMGAGIAVYEPLKVHKIGKGHKVGIVGLGGLGIIGIRIAKALGCEVVAISRSFAKKQQALDAGADGYVAMSAIANISAQAGSLDLILNTIPIEHDAFAYVPMLKSSGKQVMLGITSSFLSALLCNGLMRGKCPIISSGIGGILNTQEVINLCDEHGIYPDTRLVPVSEINKIFEIQDKGNDAGVRYVLDIAGSLTETAFDNINCGLCPKFHEYIPQLTLWNISRELARMLYSFFLRSLTVHGVISAALPLAFKILLRWYR